jgi:hypothetical protein
MPDEIKDLSIFGWGRRETGERSGRFDEAG